MRYRVLWEKRAENELAELWLSAEDRNTLTRLTNEIDEILAKEGIEAGESRAGTVRILFNLPLACYFQYRESDSVILVVQLWQC